MFSSLRATVATQLAADEPPWFDDRLATPEPQRLSLPRQSVLLLVLVIACFIPRGMMAWRINTICVDGVVYFRLANDLEHHQVAEQDAGHLQAGTYPMALAGLHRLGFDWETAAEFYGVLLSTLAVLPLFGWVRRQFDDRVATVACLLYSFHPKLIEWSPEAVREPSFWFFFLLALYLIWRAAVEVDWRLFAAGGAVVALTCLTRFEGWFLLFPLVGWTALRFLRLRTGRARLVCGFVCGTIALPLVFFAFGQLLPGGNGWEHLRIEPVQRAGTWLLSWSEYLVEAPEAPPTVAVAPSGPPAAAPATFRETLTMFVRICERGLTPLFGIFMLGGLLVRWRLFLRSNNWPILLVVLAVAGGIWIHLWYAHQASSRYMLTIVLVSMQCAAIGLFEFGRLAGRWLSVRWPHAQLVATAGALVIVAAVGTVDAVSSDFQSRAALANLGKWIHDQYGQSSVVVGSENQLMLVGYYAQGDAYFFPPELSGEALAGWIAQVKPDAVVISKRRQSPADYQPIVDRCEQLGLAVVEQDQIATPVKNILVLARTQPRPAHIRQATLPPLPIPELRAISSPPHNSSVPLTRCPADMFLSVATDKNVAFALLASLLASLALTPVARAIARRLHVVDVPDGARKCHERPVPLWGGIAVYLAIAAGVVVARYGAVGSAAFDQFSTTVILACGLVCLVGCIDDSRDLPARFKLLLQIGSVLPVVLAGYYFDRVVAFGYPIDLGWFGIPLTILWLVGCINALNLLDGLDGLASVVGISASLMMAIIATNSGHPHVGIVALLAAGSLAGFLVYNLPPASIFLGDSGSMVIGLLVGMISIQGALKTSATLSIAVPAVVMSIPMLDTVFAIVRRKLSGQRFDTADRGHIHHRLLERGLTKWQALCIIGALCLTTGAAATAATIFRFEWVGWITAIALIVLLVRTRSFGHHEVALAKQHCSAALARWSITIARYTTRWTHRRPQTTWQGAWHELLHDNVLSQATGFELLLANRASQARYSWRNPIAAAQPFAQQPLVLTFTQPDGTMCQLQLLGLQPASETTDLLPRLMARLNGLARTWQPSDTLSLPPPGVECHRTTVDFWGRAA